MLNYLLSSDNQKQLVGLALTPGLGLEATVYDKDKGVILKYGRRKVEYNFSTREIQDYVQFKTAVVELMDELKITPKSLVYFVLPNVYFDFTEVPPTVNETEIKTILLSQAEEFYIFKREEPVSGWAQVLNPDSATQKRYAYSPFQKSAIDDIKDIISDIGLQLIGIETSYSATLRGLYTSRLIDDIILEEAYWTVMLIGTNSYTLFNMYGKNLLECNEVPLAIKSFSKEEAYQAIISSSSQLLQNFPASRLYIVSQTDDICADVLKKQMQFDREAITVDSNKFAKKPLMEVVSAANPALANAMSLAVIGAAQPKSELNLTLNCLADDPEANTGIYFTTKILGTTVDITTDVVKRLSLAFIVLTIIVSGVLIGLASLVNNTALKNIDELNNKINILQKQIAQETEGDKVQEIDMNSIIDEIAQSNVTAMRFYDSISTDIPQNVWLTKYYNKDGNKIAIQGIAENIVDIYDYYKNLRIVSPESNIKLTELKVVTGDEGDDPRYRNIAIDKDADRLYSFEIANTEIEMESDQKGASGSAANPSSNYSTSEFEIIKKGKDIELPSSQMKPANLN